MKKRIKNLFAGGVLACVVFGAAMAGPLDDARAALQRGDYAVAMRLFRPLADQGDALAQTSIGVMYTTGLGVPQNYALAAAWYRKAAEQGDTMAQATLGGMYATGQGVPQDYVLAHMWSNLAASREIDDRIRENAAKCRDELAVKMTLAQIAEAQQMAREWKPK
jgi:hypothetical protein